jgi:hypothetical protein
MSYSTDGSSHHSGIKAEKYLRKHYKEESNMSYSTDGSSHHSGIKTEKYLREYLQGGK